jgi:hypothetical protein
VLIPIFISLLVRIVLGQWFKVMILAPAIAITLLLATAAACRRVAWAIGLNATGAVVGLQIGYLLAMIIHRLIVPVRVSHWRPEFVRRFLIDAAPSPLSSFLTAMQRQTHIRTALSALQIDGKSTARPTPAPLLADGGSTSRKGLRSSANIRLKRRFASPN